MERTKQGRHGFIAFLIAFAIAMAAFFIPLALTSGDAYGVTAKEKKAEADKMVEKLDALQTEINAKQAEYDAALKAYNDAIAAQKAAEQKIAECEQRIAEIKQQLSDRAVSIYRNGRPSMMDVLLGAESFSDFATNMSMVDKINDHDKALVEECRKAREEAEAARIEAQKQGDEAAKQMEVAKAAKAELQKKASEMKKEIDKLNKEYEELLAEEKAQAEAAKKAEEAAKRRAREQGYKVTDDVIAGTGQFAHPCPGYRMISSTFGWRSFDNSFHKGVDFAAAQGTPIYAAEAGTVIIAGYSSSAGNWVVISHGGGLTTKYMHMATTPYVTKGTQVKKGQNIGVVGTTGYSTGPHLHFQVEIGGEALNPMYYL